MQHLFKHDVQEMALAQIMFATSCEMLLIIQRQSQGEIKAGVVAVFQDSSESSSIIQLVSISTECISDS